MIEIVFLGTGAAVPSKQRNHAAIWLNYENEALLWDCGEGTQRQLMAAKLSFMKINRIFITHWHGDHWAGLIGLLATMNLEGRRKPLWIYGPEADRFVSDILDLGYWGPRFTVNPVNVPFEGREITELWKTKEFMVSSIPVKHSVPSVAYCFQEADAVNVDIAKAKKLYGLGQGPLVGKLKEKGEVTVKGTTVRLEDVGYVKKGLKVVYSGDTMYTENLVKLAQGADLLIHDATFLEGKENRMHSGVAEAARVAREAGAKQLVLSHFSRRYQDVSPLEKEAQTLFPNTVAARDFMAIRLRQAKQPTGR